MFYISDVLNKISSGDHGPRRRERHRGLVPPQAGHLPERVEATDFCQNEFPLQTPLRLLHLPLLRVFVNKMELDRLQLARALTQVNQNQEEEREKEKKEEE